MAFEGRWFDAKYYIEQNVDVANNWGGTALEHYLAWGAGENRAPNIWFDAQYYRANNPDLQTMTAVELFQHYEMYGYAEGRVPNALYADFDAAAYLADYADLEPGGITLASALNHYLTFGIAEGRIAKNTSGTVITPADPDGGGVFTLTTEIFENVIGTAANEQFNAVANAGGIGAGETFNVGDKVDGLGGIDTFNLLATSPAAGINGRTTNVEIINLIGEIAGVDGFATVNAARFEGAEQIWQINGAVAGVINVAAGTTVGFRDVTLGPGIVVAAGVDTASVALDGVATGGTLFVSESLATLVDLVTVNVSGSVAGAGALTINLDAAVLVGAAPGAEETLNLALTSDSAITILSGSLETIDASASTGDLTMTAVGTVTAFIGGSGDDILTTGAAVGVVEGGAGADTINILGGAKTVVIGEGDTGITLATIDVINGFLSLTDTLAFGLADGNVTNFLDGGISSGYVDALTNANTAFDGTVQYFFSDDTTNGWLFVDRDLDGTADEAVQLSGVIAIVAGDIVAAA
jgi:hypothetical protein